MTSRYAMLFALCCGAASACHGFPITTPPAFVELEDQDFYDYRATTADGLVLAVRELDHEPVGNTAFWMQAIENSLRSRGYAKLSLADIKTKSGHAGKLLRFGHDEGGSPHLYWVGLFVTDDTLYVVEAGGRKELVQKHESDLTQAIESIVID